MGARQSFPGSQTFPRSLSQSYGDASAIVLGQNLAPEPYRERHSQQLLYGSNGNLATATQEGTTAGEKAAMVRPVGGVTTTSTSSLSSSSPAAAVMVQSYRLMSYRTVEVRNSE